ncbi:uncharacterized protein LJ264_016549 [Porphyrio hochstetteri]
MRAAPPSPSGSPARRGAAGTALPRRGPAPSGTAETKFAAAEVPGRRGAGRAGGRLARCTPGVWMNRSRRRWRAGAGGRGRRLGGAALGSTLFSILMRAERGLWIFTLRREPPPFIHPHGPRARPPLPPGPAFAPLPFPPPPAPLLFPIRPAGQAARLRSAGLAGPRRAPGAAGGGKKMVAAAAAGCIDTCSRK